MFVSGRGDGSLVSLVDCFHSLCVEGGEGDGRKEGGGEGEEGRIEGEARREERRKITNYSTSFIGPIHSKRCQVPQIREFES